MNNWPWEELGLPGPAQLPAIRRAYAERLKKTRPDENPEGFQRLHSAYEEACHLARRGSAARTESDSRPPEEENREPVRDWDFERLFAEGEAEERGRRFQKLWILRQKNRFRYDTWRPPPSRDPAEAALVWVAVSRALSLVEELSYSGAEASLWGAFCKSELFLCVRNQPDFVFGLEDFLRNCPEVPETGCQALFRAYGFGLRPAGREYGLLCRLLKERIPDPERGTVGNLACLPSGRKRSGIPQRLSFLLLLTLAVLMVNVLIDSAVLSDFRKDRVRDWLEEDFGHEFVRVKDGRPGPSFILLDSRTRFYFQARWDGPRDTRRGRPGYVTNYTSVRMSQQIADFAEQRADVTFRCRNAGDLAAAREDWNGDYLRLPLTGAGDDISALGDLLSDVRREAWYQTSPPDYALYLCWHDWSFYEYNARTDDFDAAALRRYYERSFGPDLCRIALDETGIAAADMGEAFFLFPESGTVKLEKRNFFHVVGVEKEHFTPRYHYLLSVDGRELFCVPTGGKLSELTLRELRRMDRTDYEVKGFPEPLSVFREVADT
ncbi:MAG: J domain-containing protein [Oscillibacter sp.]|nr:J domain-containing protein [Oscillibacter sp.]